MLPWVCSVSHRSQMTSKCEKKNKEVAMLQVSVSFIHSFIMIVYLVKQVKLKGR